MCVAGQTRQGGRDTRATEHFPVSVLSVAAVVSRLRRGKESDSDPGPDPGIWTLVRQNNSAERVAAGSHTSPTKSERAVQGNMSSALEAKIVVLGSQGVGKTSLVMRYCKGAFNPSQVTSTVGASFMTKRVVDSDTDTVVRLQIWDTGMYEYVALTNLPAFRFHPSDTPLPPPNTPDNTTGTHTNPSWVFSPQTAGQERFRSISRLYYRGANACILCYSITDAQSFADMGAWLTELRRNLPHDIVLHIVGTKSDVVAREPATREVPFERCIHYVAENLAPGLGSTPPATATTPGGHLTTLAGGTTLAGSFGNNNNNNGGFFSSSESPSAEPRSPTSKRSSGFWGQEVGWDACHEISAESGEGVEEVFRVVTRKLVEQNRKMQAAILAATSTATPGLTPGLDGASSAGGIGYDGAGGGPGGYFDGANARGGSFRVGRDRRSWLFSPGFSPSVTVERAGQDGRGQQQQQQQQQDGEIYEGRRGKKCC